MKGLKVLALLFVALGLSLTLGSVGTYTQAQGQKIVWVSTQLVPIQEAEFVRNEILKPFTEETGIEVEFIGAEYGELFTRLEGEAKAGQGTTDLVGGLQGDFVGVAEFMDDISDVLAGLTDRTFAEGDVALGNIGGAQVFVPWMRATYLMMANKKALEYLPEGADVNALTYEQLVAWGQALLEATGEKKLGIPAGPRSLLHRFVHGYAYPSFTGSTVKKFASEEAVAMWEFLRDQLWPYVNPAVATADAMDTLLLEETVWVAWDHTARLKQAPVERPDDFLAIPAPSGPFGRGYIAILAGLGIPKTAPNRDAAAQLIEYLTRPETQVKILEGVGFFPSVAEAAGAVPPGALKVLAEGVSNQAGAPDALPALIPGGLGPRGGEFGKIYRDTFIRIVLQGEDIQTVLQEQGELLDTLFEETGAACPLPDPPEQPCSVEGL
jgi:multiple sugar transport system substrate-binding protein